MNMIDCWRSIYLLLEMVIFQFHFSFISGDVICNVCVPQEAQPLSIYLLPNKSKPF